MASIQDLYQGVASGQIRLTPEQFGQLFSNDDGALSQFEFQQFSPEVQAWAMSNPQQFMQSILANRNPANNDLGSIGAEGGHSNLGGVGVTPDGSLDYSNAGYMQVHDDQWYQNPLALAALGAGIFFGGAGLGLWGGLGEAAGAGALTQEAMLAEQYLGMGLGAEEAAAMAAADMASFGEMGAYGIGFGADTIPGYAAMTAEQQAAFTGLVNSGVPTSTAITAVMGGGASSGGGWLAGLGLGGAGTAAGGAALSGAGGLLSGLGSAGGLAAAGLGALAGGLGPSSGTSTTTSGPPEWLQKELQGYLGNANKVAAGSQYVPMNNYQTDALQGIAFQAMEGTQANYSGQQQLNDTLNGYYLNSNPYLDYNINKAQNDLVHQYQLGTAAQTDAAAARSHALGGSSYNQLTAYNNNNLANQLNNVDATMRGANYSNERNNQMSALGQVPGMINANYADWNNLYNAGNMLQQQYQTQASWPEHQLGIQQSAMQTALGGAGTVQSTPWQTNQAAGLLGGAATGLSLWNQFNGGS